MYQQENSVFGARVIIYVIQGAMPCQRTTVISFIFNGN